MAAKGGDSKQALTISLVLFVLLSIILGVVAYLGYSEQGDLTRDLKNARDEKKTVQDLYNRERLQRVIYKIGAGHGEQDKQDEERNDYRTYSALHNQFPEQVKEELARMKKRNPGFDWPEGKDRPPVTYLQQVLNLQKALDQEKKKTEDADKLAKEAEKARDDALKQAADQRAAFNKDITDLQQKLAKVPEDKSEGFKKLQDDYTNLQNEVKEKTERLGKMSEEYEKRIADLNGQVAKVTTNLKQAQEKIAPINMLALDPPKAKVVSVDRSGGIAYIDIGSGDRVRPGLTFSIFGAGADGKPRTDAKGTLEVTDVLYPHLSKARITGLRNSNRDPVLTGDFLFNPAWHPDIRERVAVAGVIDLSGDGRDSSAEFIRNLEQQGIIIDAYVDFKDGKEGVVKGKVSRQTTYLIEGDNPGSTKVTDLKKQAVDLGVTVVPARRFIALMGVKMPRNTTGVADWSGYTRPGQLADDRMIDARDPNKKLEREPPKEKEVPKVEDKRDVPPKEDEKKDAPKEEKKEEK
jgi:hypothetical protein